MRHSRGSLRKPHIAIALLLIPTGLAILAPGPLEAAVAFFNRRFDLALPAPPWWVGIGLVVVGVGIFVFGESRAASKKPLVLIHHHSLPGVRPAMAEKELPWRLRRHQLTKIECDQTPFMAPPQALDAAVRIQQSRFQSLTALSQVVPDLAIAYYGIAHVPLLFLAGADLSTGSKVALFELNRYTNTWRELSRSGRNGLNASSRILHQPTTARSTAIRVCVSYEVTPHDVAPTIDASSEDIRVGIPEPRLDSVTSYRQIEEFCRVFRSALDDTAKRYDRDHVVNIFYAGPASLAFSLGRQISKTTHPRVVVYNYEANAGYPWGLVVNGAQEPARMVVRPGKGRVQQHV